MIREFIDELSLFFKVIIATLIKMGLFIWFLITMFLLELWYYLEVVTIYTKWLITKGLYSIRYYFLIGILKIKNKSNDKRGNF